MSFKRDGDDKSSLANLRQRRIADLFSEDIPEDEAKLLSNGKLSCLVCGNRPIFDTMAMLAIHRKGKKHLFYEQLEQKKKEELRELIRKRKHEQYLKDGSTNIKMATQSTGGYVPKQPYNSRSKRKKMKPHERRPCIDLSQSETRTTDADSLPGNQKTTLESLREQLKVHSSSLQTNKLKHFCSKNTDSFQIKPYTSSKMVGSFLNNATCPDNTEFDHTKSSSHESSALYQQSENSSHCTSSTLSLNSVKKLPPPENSVYENERNPSEEEEKARKYLDLRGAGWKKDWDGKWIKDEDAEFDSDEEAPDL